MTESLQSDPEGMSDHVCMCTFAFLTICKYTQNQIVMHQYWFLFIGKMLMNCCTKYQWIKQTPELPTAVLNVSCETAKNKKQNLRAAFVCHQWIYFGLLMFHLWNQKCCGQMCVIMKWLLLFQSFKISHETNQKQCFNNHMLLSFF